MSITHDRVGECLGCHRFKPLRSIAAPITKNPPGFCDDCLEAARRRQSIEVVWGPKSRRAHVRVDFDGIKVKTLCGRTLAALMDNYWIEPGQPLDPITCDVCRKRVEANSS